MGVGATDAMVLSNTATSGPVFTPPRSTVVGSAPMGSSVSFGPIPNTTHNTVYGAPRFQNTTSANYQADFSKFKEDLANTIRTKLGIDMSSSRLY